MTTTSPAGGERQGHRHVSAAIDLGSGSPAEIVLRLAVARTDDVVVLDESLVIDGQALRIDTQADGSAIAFLRTTGRASRVEYAATVAPTRTRHEQRVPEASALILAERLEFTTPSRFCPSDLTAGLASSMFGSVSASDAIDLVAEWVHRHLVYRFFSSQVTTTALDTLGSASGVCRDFANLTICFLRGLGVPARYVAVYAPGLKPQDFHALVEAHDGERWRLVDATRLTDTAEAIRIASGRDSADTPFLAVLSGMAPVVQVTVSAGDPG